MDEDLYFLSAAARLLGMHPQTLRKYERLGLIQPSRTIGSMRLYSRRELERLRVIKRMVDDAGINLAGVQRLLLIAEVVQRIRPLVREDTMSARDALFWAPAREGVAMFTLPPWTRAAATRPSRSSSAAPRRSRPGWLRGAFPFNLSTNRLFFV